MTDDGPELLYEKDDKGNPTLVRSIDANVRAYLRFTNRTTRPVDIWWRDYRGVRKFYTRLAKGSYYDVNTFLTHPWQFTDASTKELYVINNYIIFRPPVNIGDKMYRTNWNITISVRTLRRTALLAAGNLLPYPDAALELGLPVNLGKELKRVTEVLNRPLSPISS